MENVSHNTSYSESSPNVLADDEEFEDSKVSLQQEQQQLVGHHHNLPFNDEDFHPNNSISIKNEDDDQFGADDLAEYLDDL